MVVNFMNMLVFIVDGEVFVMCDFMLDIVNVVESWFFIGFESVLIMDCVDSFEIIVEVKKLIEFDFFIFVCD